MQVGSGEKAEKGFTVTSRRQEEKAGIMEYWNDGILRNEKDRRQETE
jgi:hypothetical protein